MAEPVRWFVLGSALAAWLLVGLVRWIALAYGVIDHPGDRSSHALATPRGGGLGLLIAALGAWTWQATRSATTSILLVVLGASLVALVGWLDDRRGLPVRTRLAVHVVSALFVGWIAASGTRAGLIGVALFIWWTFWTVSSVNLVNFMDGINGLVASQVTVFALSLALFPPSNASTSFYALVLAAACIGFLPWNFPRARIFLGDVGSGGLGYLVSALTLLVMQERGIDIVRAHLPLLPLFGDATATIVRRWRRGERLTEAHRGHLYQRLANGRLNHTVVTSIYAVAALLGVAAAHVGEPSTGWIWMLAYAALTIALGLALDRFASGGNPVPT
jgi:UDP-N-acetylmuramyl pentapeptide phosphotransferase/UDP-N-acetylglucosamine-1-phosphate transferase